MHETKIFAGPHIRRIRNGLGLTQTAMASGIGISPSYLNLIERNQRPLTVQLILRLSEVYGVDPGELRGGKARELQGELKAIFADPLLADELPGDQELGELAATAPNVAAGLAKLYRAYREQHERLSDLSELLAREGRGTPVAAARLPLDEVRDVLENRPNHYAAIEAAAERLHQSFEPGDDPGAVLRGWLRSRHDIAVRVLPADVMPIWRRRFDRHSRRLFLSERLSAADRLREVAAEVFTLAYEDVVASEADSFGFSGPEALRLARLELMRYAAHALMMPYAPFQTAAERCGYDVTVLASRFGVSFEQAAQRLTTLQRASAPGIPFFLMEVDHAGNRIRRVGARGFPAQRFGGDCPKLPIHMAFAQPDAVLAEMAEMPGGASFLLVTRTVDGPTARFGERPRRTAILIGCDAAHKDATIYGRQLGSGAVPTPIGPACRFCERQACIARAAPPLTRPLGLDERVGGLSPFDFQ
ncbi:helix-turn-helix domain-containing protein [Mangrovicella endophytica]|uniref:helix-turn-helix domain-containing protein n=1 Tax=Mangrovicella endophytica TaxID=2066697 RepID=UPI000C9E4DDC|nr:short-chain fatty acyl-CoA regulator family protein [Mangrovicella endophytica]